MTSELLAAVSRRPSPDPIRHALPWDYAKEPGQTTVPAVCGARVAVAVGDWSPDHDRACPACREVAR